jgi:hypothetical protein
MNDPDILLDPTSERSNAMRARHAPPSSLDNLTVGLLDITKGRGDIFLDRLESLFGARGIKVERFAKPTYTKKAPDEVSAALAERCDVVVEALAD